MRIVVVFAFLLVLFVITSPLADAKIIKTKTDDDVKKKKDLLSKTQKEYKSFISTFDDLEDSIQKLEQKIYRYEMDEKEKSNEVESLKQSMRDAETDYRHSLDINVKDDTDIKKQESALKRLKDSTKSFDNAEKKYNDFMKEYKNAKNELVKLKTQKNEFDVKLLAYLKQIDAIKIDLRKSMIKNKFISIIISETCHRVECIKYRDLLIFDNTIPSISGKFVERDGDMRRDTSKYTNYWNWYKQKTDWVIVTVDPDSDILKRGAVITIMPDKFIYVKQTPAERGPSIDVKKHERYVEHDLKFDNECRDAIVSPNLELIQKAIDHLVSNCTTVEPTKTETIKLKQTPYDRNSSPAYQEQLKWEEAMKRCKIDPKKC